MFGFKYYKGDPNNYVFLYSGDHLIKRGKGLSFIYFSPTRTVVEVPTESGDILFSIQEMTADFQPVSLRGQISYFIQNPELAAKHFNYALDEDGKVSSEEQFRLEERVSNSAREIAREFLISKPLREVLKQGEKIVEHILEELKQNNSLAAIGVQVEDLSMISLETTPELLRALEAESRELMQKSADLAIYDRRNNSVEQERLIKENELKTEIAVEEKKREIRQSRIAADIAIEEERRKLIESKIENDKKMADSNAYNIEKTIEPLKDTDWKLLMALNAGSMDANTMMAMSFREIAENAEKIGQFNFTPELLAAIARKE